MPLQADTLFDRWWSAATSEAAAGVGEEIAASGISFEAAVGRLKAGRPYSRRVPTGIVRSSRSDNSVEFFYVLNVPDDYDPARSYPVRKTPLLGCSVCSRFLRALRSLGRDIMTAE